MLVALIPVKPEGQVEELSPGVGAAVCGTGGGVGAAVGCFVGLAVIGEVVGCFVGSLVGDAIGDGVGAGVTGDATGELVTGDATGAEVTGDATGDTVGDCDVGAFVGKDVGEFGLFEGAFVGEAEGLAVGVGGAIVGEDVGEGVRGGPPAQFILGFASLELTESRRGVDKSSIRSPEISQIKNPSKSLSITYSVFSQIDLSSSKETKPDPLSKKANGVFDISCLTKVISSLLSTILKYWGRPSSANQLLISAP